MIPKEDVVVTISNEGYVKRSSKRSYDETVEAPTKEGDYIIGIYDINTKDTLLLFTNLGNFLYIPVYLIPESKWKDIGKHVSNIIGIQENERIVSCIKVTDFTRNCDILLATKDGMIKRTKLEEFKLLRYNKPVGCMKLKDKDEVIDAFISTSNNIFTVTDSGYGLWFDINEVPVVGIKASGVKAMKLMNDHLVSVINFSTQEYISVITNHGTGKRVKITEFDKSLRARRGLMIVREVKTNPYKILKAFILDNRDYIGLRGLSINNVKVTELGIADRYSTGNTITKDQLIEAFQVKKLTKEDDIEIIDISESPKVVRPSLKEIDDQLKSIDEII